MFCVHWEFPFCSSLSPPHPRTLTSFPTPAAKRPEQQTLVHSFFFNPPDEFLPLLGHVPSPFEMWSLILEEVRKVAGSGWAHRKGSRLGQQGLMLTGSSGQRCTELCLGAALPGLEGGPQSDLRVLENWFSRHYFIMVSFLEGMYFSEKWRWSCQVVAYSEVIEMLPFSNLHLSKGDTELGHR